MLRVGSKEGGRTIGFKRLLNIHLILEECLPWENMENDRVGKQDLRVTGKGLSLRKRRLRGCSFSTWDILNKIC